MTKKEKSSRKIRSKIRMHTGFRYLRNDGQETGEIIFTRNRRGPYFDTSHQMAYTESGVAWYATTWASENLVSTISHAK